MSIKRYDIAAYSQHDEFCTWEEYESADGDWVNYAEAAALEAKLSKACELLKDVKSGRCPDWFVRDAIAAFLAEVGHE